MLVKEIVGNLKDISVDKEERDILALEWYETAKRIQRKRSKSGREIALKLLQEKVRLSQDDIIWKDEQLIISIDIIPCEAILVKPGNIQETAAVCYEIGNKHLPLFMEDEQLYIPYEAPIFRWLQASGYQPTQVQHKLLHPLNTTVSPHGHGDHSLFTKILQLAAGK